MSSPRILYFYCTGNFFQNRSRVLKKISIHHCHDQGLFPISPLWHLAYSSAWFIGVGDPKEKALTR